MAVAARLATVARVVRFILLYRPTGSFLPTLFIGYAGGQSGYGGQAGGQAGGYGGAQSGYGGQQGY